MLALALGDPAGAAVEDPLLDPLVAADVLYPPEAPVPAELARRLDAAVARSESPIKVALILAPSDLRERSAFFGRPQALADFLRTALDAHHDGAVLVVMPAGAAVSPRTTGDLGGVPAGSGAAGVVSAALVALERLGRSDPDDDGSTGLVIGIAVGGAAAASALVAALLLRRRSTRSRAERGA